MSKYSALAVGLLITLTTPTTLHSQQRSDTYDYVASVTVREDGYVTIKVWTIGVGPGFRAPQGQGCLDSLWAQFRLPITDEKTKALMQIALTSAITRSKIYVITNGCTPAHPGMGANQFPAITGLGLCRIEGNYTCP